MSNKNTSKYTHLSGEINSIYHELAVKLGISDSVMDILYIINENGTKCLQSEISKLTGVSRQTINTAIKKLEKDKIIYLEQGQGRNKIVCLTEKGKKFSKEKILPIFKMEEEIWNNWREEEQEQFLNFMTKYRDLLKKYTNNLF